MVFLRCFADGRASIQKSRFSFFTKGFFIRYASRLSTEVDFTLWMMLTGDAAAPQQAHQRARSSRPRGAYTPCPRARFVFPHRGADSHHTPPFFLEVPTHTQPGDKRESERETVTLITHARTRTPSGLLRSAMSLSMDASRPTGATTNVENGGSTSAAGAPHPELSHAEIRRYSRHLILDDVGVQGQRRLKATKSSALEAAASGRLRSCTSRLQESGPSASSMTTSSMNPTCSGRSSTAPMPWGPPKVDSAEGRVGGINPHVEFIKHRLRLTAANALEVVAPYDLVVDGSDNFPTRYLVNDACILLGKPLIYGAVQKFEGQVSVFNYRGGPNYRDLFPEPPPPGEVPSCAEGGVLGILPGVIGCLQATEAIKVALGVESGTLSGRLLIYNAMRMRFHEVRMAPRSGAPPITQLIDYDGFCRGEATCASTAKKPRVEREPFEHIGVDEAARRMRDDSWQPFVLDVRSRAEAEIVSLPCVDLLQPHRQVAHAAERLPRDRDILVHCKGGVRSKAACHTLAGLGFTRLYTLDGGIIDWAKRIDQSMPIY